MLILKLKNRMLKQAIKHKVMPHLMEQALRLKIQVVIPLKPLRQPDQRQSQKNIHWEQL